MKSFTERIDLSGADWRIKEFLDLDWMNRDTVSNTLKTQTGWIQASVPGSIAADLIRNGEIEDVFYECNSKAAEWVSQRTFAYRKEFVSPLLDKRQRAFLYFEGIDYSSEIYLNGEHLGHQENLFVPVCIEVTDVLKQGRNNVLAVIVSPAPAEYSQMGYTDRTSTMKPRMTYGWDFCPRLPHTGIWRPVYLKLTGEAAINDIQIQQSVDFLSDRAVLSYRAKITGKYAMASFQVGDISCDGKSAGTVTIEKPRLWWCNGYGEPYEYPVIFRIFDEEENILDEYRLFYGIRSLTFELNDGPNDGTGRFQIYINQKRIFASGCNWVPASIFYGTVTMGMLEQRIRLAAAAGINFLRVWGGGLIETREFYRLCARYGILVLQEFPLSSSGISNCPPEQPEYLKMLEHDGRIIVQSRRNETALAMWDGGNELTFPDFSPIDSGNITIGTIEKIVQQEDPGRYFIPSSPFGRVFSNSLSTIREKPDDQYDVHGPWEHQGLTGQHQLYNAGMSMAHTEFGTEGMTNKPVLERCAAKEHLMPVDKTNAVYRHRGSWWINTSLLEQVFPGKMSTLENIRQASQYMQYDGLRYALNADRSRKRCTMVLPWQFNEPFPEFMCTSLVDADGREKMAYSALKEVYAPYSIFVRTESTLISDHQLQAQIFCIGKANRKNLILRVTVFSMDGDALFSKNFDTAVECTGGGTLAGELDIRLEDSLYGLYLLRATLSSGEGECLAEHEELFGSGDSLKGVFDMKPPVLEIKTVNKNNHFIATVRSANKTPILFLRMMAECGSMIPVGRSCICILPGESGVLESECTTGQFSAAVEGLNVTYENIENGCHSGN